MAKDSPSVSVIILNYNGQKFLNNCLKSVFKTNYPNFEVILVDNASTDQSLRMAKDAFGSDERLKIVANTENLGFSGGNNLGLKYASGKYISLLNNDTEVDPQWLKHLVNTLENDESIGLAQSLILMIDGEAIQWGGWLYSDFLIYLAGLATKKPSDLKLKPVYEVPIVSGVSMIIPRKLVEEIGLFNPQIPFFYDDTQLSFKTWLAGKRAVTVSDSRVRHIGGATSLWNVRFTSYNFLKAKICLLFDVYFQLGDLVKALFVNFFSITLNSFFNLKDKNFNAILANVSALGWAIKNFPFLWKNRLNHWSKTKVSHGNLKEKFVRVNLPVPLYLLPSKLGNEWFQSEVAKYERSYLLERR
jgi:GT2 family glycosyltransferase